MPKTPKTNSNGYISIVEIKILNEVAIENFLKSPLACMIVRNKEL